MKTTTDRTFWISILAIVLTTTGIVATGTVQVGKERAGVIAELGQPDQAIRVGTGEVLVYGDRQVVLEHDTVVYIMLNGKQRSTLRENLRWQTVRVNRDAGKLSCGEDYAKVQTRWGKPRYLGKIGSRGIYRYDQGKVWVENGLVTRFSPDRNFRPGVPAFRETLSRGLSELVIRNRLGTGLELALRKGTAGINIGVRDGGVTTVRLPAGDYDIYLLRSDEPSLVFVGDMVALHPYERTTLTLEDSDRLSPNGELIARQ